MEQKIITHQIKGIIIALILIVIGLIIYFAGLQQNKALQNLQYIIYAVGIIICCIHYSKQHGGNVTFGNTFAHGFKTSAVVTIILIAYTFISLTFIMPEIKDAALAEVRKNMELQNRSTEQIDSTINLTKKFFNIFAVAAVLLTFLIIGVVSSLIGAAIAKKNPNYNPLS